MKLHTSDHLAGLCFRFLVFSFFFFYVYTRATGYDETCENLVPERRPVGLHSPGHLNRVWSGFLCISGSGLYP